MRQPQCCHQFDGRFWTAPQDRKQPRYLVAYLVAYCGCLKLVPPDVQQNIDSKGTAEVCLPRPTSPVSSG